MEATDTCGRTWGIGLFWRKLPDQHTSSSASSDLSRLWKVHVGGDAVSHPLIQKQLIQVFQFAFLFNYVLFTNPDPISYFIFGCMGYGRQCCSHWPAARWHGGKWMFVWLLHYKTASCSCSPSRIPPYSAAKPYPSKGAILICRVPCEIYQLETSQTLICMSPTGACNSTYGMNSSDLAD